MENRAIETGGRRTVAIYDIYADAQRAVDYLSDQGFPVERVSIVADGIRVVEQVTGRKSYSGAAMSGIVVGALTGALFGFIFGLFNWIDPLVSGLVLALYGSLFGALVGAMIGLIGHALTSGRRDFSSISGLDAERYSVMVDAGVAEEASGLLSAFSGSRTVPPAGGRGASPAI